MVGFYCIEKASNHAIHFLFSCRTLGMGIEQYVYQLLRYPSMKVIAPVTVDLKDEVVVSWVCLDSTEGKFKNIASDVVKYQKSLNSSKCRILLKGPCDMFALQPCLGGVHIDTEFNHVNEAGVTISSHNHTSSIVQAKTLSVAKKREIIEACPFFDESLFETEIFSDKYNIVFLSLLTDCLQGTYIDKTDNQTLINIGNTNVSLNVEGAVSKYAGSLNGWQLTEVYAQKFRERFEFRGMLLPEQIIDNIKFIRDHMDKNTLLVLLLGSEIDCETDDYGMKGAGNRHKQVNDAVKSNFAGRQDI